MLPTPSDVHVNAPLTNISIAYMQSQSSFIADKVFPNVPVAKQSDRYYQFDRGDFNRDAAEVRAPATESAGGGFKVDNTPTYYCPVHAYHKDIDDQMLANADSVLSLDRAATEFVMHKMLLKREVQWSTNYFAASVWTNDWSGVASGSGTDTFVQWDQAASTPIEDVRGAKTTVLESTGFEPNKLILGRHVYDSLVDHADIVDRVKYGQTAGSPAMAGTNTLAQLFEVDAILVPRAIQNTGNESTTFEGNNSHSFIQGKHALLVYAAPAPALMTPSAGYTFSWNGLLGSSAAGHRMSRFRMENIKSTRVEAEMSFDQKMVAADLGYFFGSAVA
jgi:hypothetical protein